MTKAGAATWLLHFACKHACMRLTLGAGQPQAAAQPCLAAGHMCSAHMFGCKGGATRTKGVCIYDQQPRPQRDRVHNATQDPVPYTGR